MNSTTAFSQIDHPGIIFGQCMTALTLFVLWVLVRKRPAPMPQIVLFFALTVLANLAGRVTKAYWFAYADIVEYNVWWVMNGVWDLSVIFQITAKTGAGDENGKSAFLYSPVFSRANRNLVSGFCAIVLGLFLFYVGSLYSEKIEATVKGSTAYFVGYATAVNQQGSRDKQAQASRDSIAAALFKKNIQDSLWREYIKKDRQQQLAAIKDLKKIAAKPVVVKAGRPALIIVAPTAKGLPSGNFPMPDPNRVTVPDNVPVKPRRGRKVADADEDAEYSSDSLILAKYIKNEK